jgi:hypothetical protein
MFCSRRATLLEGKRTITIEKSSLASVFGKCSATSNDAPFFYGFAYVDLHIDVFIGIEQDLLIKVLTDTIWRSTIYYDAV